MKPTNFDLALARAGQRTKERIEAQAALDRAKGREQAARALADPARALKNLKATMKLRQKNLLDPNWDHKRTYPCFFPGQTTREYIRSYQALNRHTSNAPELTFDYRNGIAPYADGPFTVSQVDV